MNNRQITAIAWHMIVAAEGADGGDVTTILRDNPPDALPRPLSDLEINQVVDAWYDIRESLRGKADALWKQAFGD